MQPGEPHYNHVLIQNWMQTTKEILDSGVLDKGQLVAYIATRDSDKLKVNNDSTIA